MHARDVACTQPATRDPRDGALIGSPCAHSVRGPAPVSRLIYPGQLMDRARGARDAIAVLKDGVDYLRGGSLDRAWQQFVTAARLSTDPATLSEALRRQADVKRRRADWTEALELVARAVQIARDHALRDATAAALNVKATIHHQRGDVDHAISVYREALSFDPGGHQRGLVCQNLGTAYAELGDHEQAAAWYAESSKAFSRAGFVREQVLSMNNQASARMDQGDLVAADIILRAALRQVHADPDAEVQALVEVNLAETLARRRVELEEAYELMARATGYFTASSNRPYRVACHRVFAMVAEAQGNRDLAESALTRGLVLAREIQSTTEIGYFEREIARLRGIRPVPTITP